MLLTDKLAQMLSINDLGAVHSELIRASNSWFDLGLALNIPYFTLKNINIKCNEDCNSCLREMLAEWLTSQLAPTTWSHLCKCLRKNTVKCNDVANDIERKKGEMVCWVNLM